MDALAQEFTAGLPDGVTLMRLSLRLGLAAVMGAIVGRGTVGTPVEASPQS